MTSTLYVFTGPGRMAGTSLLMRDRIDTLEGDDMWMYLRAFSVFSHLESADRHRTVVPGTVLTYEDSRGFIPLDKYRFSVAAPLAPASDVSQADLRLAAEENLDPVAAAESGGELRVLACPRTDSLARDLGYGHLIVTVDTRKRLVRDVDYRDTSGRPLKRYRVLADQQEAKRWFPSRVRLEHLTNGTITLIEYRYWPPAEPPPRTLYAANIEREVFLPRLERYLAALGLDAILRDEIAAADARVRAWEERWGERVDLE